MSDKQSMGLLDQSWERKVLVMRQNVRAALELSDKLWTSGNSISTRLRQAHQIIEDEIHYKRIQEPTAA